MSELGEASQIHEEDLREIYSICEELVAVEASPLITVEGREFEPEMDPEEDPKEEYEGDELEGFSDGPLPKEEDVVMDLWNENFDLKEWIQELEDEKLELQQESILYSSMMVHTIARNAGLSEQLHSVVVQRDAAIQEKNTIHSYWDAEVVAGIEAVQQKDEAMDRVHDLENEVRGKNAKMDIMSYAFETAFGRWESRVYHHPAEQGQSRRVLSRKRVIKMGKEELSEAKKRGMLRR